MVANKSRQDNERTLAVSRVYAKFVMTLTNASSNFNFISFWFGYVFIRAKDFSNRPSHFLDVNTPCLPLQAMRLIHKTRKINRQSPPCQLVFL